MHSVDPVPPSRGCVAAATLLLTCSGVMYQNCHVLSTRLVRFNIFLPGREGGISVESGSDLKRLFEVRSVGRRRRVLEHRPVEINLLSPQ